MPHQPDVAKLLLRLGLGGMLLLHGIAKLQNGIGGVVSMASNAGLPGVVGYGVVAGEVIAPLMLIIGFYSRVGGVLAAVNMVFAIMLVHTNEILALTQSGGWAIELQMFYLLTAVSVALLGSGKYAYKPD